MAYIFNISKPFQIKYYVLNKRYTKVSLKTLLLQIFFAIMLMDTFLTSFRIRSSKRSLGY